MVEFNTKTSINSAYLFHKKYETFDKVTNGIKHNTCTHARTHIHAIATLHYTHFTFSMIDA